MRLCKASSGIPFFFIILGLSPITLAQNTKALTESGTIIGVREDGLSAYKGVPFASPLSANCAGGQRLLSGTVHPVIEPYVLPALPYETFASRQQNDVPLLLGSNPDQARSLTDVTQVKAATFRLRSRA